MDSKKRKLYCYVDESGQDTKGDIFIVSVVVTEEEKDELLKLCEKIEKDSGKGKFKWGKAERNRRLKYIETIFSLKIFRGKLRYAVYKGQVNYDMATIMGIAKAICYREPNIYTTSIYIDGLTKNKKNEYGSELRKLGIPTKKVQGVLKDENNSLVRLADSVAGFVRDALFSNEEISTKLFQKVIKNGGLVNV